MRRRRIRRVERRVQRRLRLVVSVLRLGLRRSVRLDELVAASAGDAAASSATKSSKAPFVVVAVAFAVGAA